MRRFILLRRYWIAPLVIWTALVGTSLLTAWESIEAHTYELALNRGRFVFSMVESIRLWNARHGGVYAPVTPETPPNPHLEVEERDITSPSGRPLTLINPAYMTRQVGEVVRELSGTAMHLTSLNPLNPDNAADPWEASALGSFRRESDTFAEFVGSGEGARFRYIAPLFTKQACLKCHEHHGYEIGDLRGGLSISLPAAEMLASRDRQRGQILGGHAAVWLLVAALTAIALSRLRAQMLALTQAKEEQESVIEQRTAELKREVEERDRAEGRLRLLLESSGEGIYGVDADGRCTFCNPTALRLLGFDSVDAVLGRDLHALIHHSWADGSPHGVDECALAEAYRCGEANHAEDDVFWRADGRPVPVEYRSHPVRQDGTVVGAVVTFDDISARKAHEQQLRKLSEAVEHSPDSVVITDREGRIEYVNRRFSEVTGYSSNEAIGQNPRILQSGQTPLATYKELWDTITAGEAWHGELLNRKKGGELYWEKASIAPIKDDMGRITHFVALKADVTERKRLQDQVWRQANFDSLTGLANRNLFHDRLEYLIARARRDGQRFAVLYLDLDSFKEVNDGYGHEAGDELLRQVADRLTTCMRRSDTVARMGGDEFIVLLPRVSNSAEARVVTDKIVQAFAEPFDIGVGTPQQVDASMGLAIYPYDGDEGDALVRSADRAMYRAKRARGVNA